MAKFSVVNPLSSFEIAKSVVQSLLDLGVQEFCLAAGSRNSPLVAAISSCPDVKSFFFFEERSAAFFALGRISAQGGRPVAVVTTSGTAAAELYPAFIEAHYAGLPLIAVTADRPERYRMTGAPQAIEQKNLYSSYPEIFWEGPSAQQLKTQNSLSFESSLLGVLSKASLKRPLHLNVFLDEPLLEAPVSRTRYEAKTSLFDQGLHLHVKESALSAAQSALQKFLDEVKNPLVICGQIPQHSQSHVMEFLTRLKAPIYAEGLSGLRQKKQLQPLLVKSGERQLKQASWDGVLRLGSVPTCRFWRDLDTRDEEISVLSLDHRPFSGLPRGEHHSVTLGSWLLEVELKEKVATQCKDFFESDFKRYEQKLQLFAKYPLAEASLFHALSKRLQSQSLLFLGNSLPIREWDLAADFVDRSLQIAANRGANGIDGEVSSFLGHCLGAGVEKNSISDCVAILGDLTTLYDLAGPWVLPQLPAFPMTLFVINNSGGQIFSRLPSLQHMDAALRKRAMVQEHRVSFEGWAKMWDLGYEKWTEGLSPHWQAGTSPTGAEQGIVELVPDSKHTEAFWKDFAGLWS